MSTIASRLKQHAQCTVMGYTERFEYYAEQFYRETGFMAPGKSVPLEMAASQPDEARTAAWDRWQIAKREAYLSDLREAIAAIVDAGEAYGYGSRLFPHLAPQCEPLPTLAGLMTQLDNYIAGIKP